MFTTQCGTSASYNALPPVITALRKLSKANRIIRRYLRSKVRYYSVRVTCTVRRNALRKGVYASVIRQCLLHEL